jgi:pyridoxal/pyridoxine/pyridoxamine kinase
MPFILVYAMYRFVGCGDLFAASLLAYMHKHPKDFPLAFELTCSAVHSVISRTAAERPGGELRLVQSRHTIANPSVKFSAVAVPCYAQPLAAAIFDMGEYYYIYTM